MKGKLRSFVFAILKNVDNFGSETRKMIRFLFIPEMSRLWQNPFSYDKWIWPE